MKNRTRSIVGVIAGVFTAFIIVFLGEMLSQSVFMAPENLNYADPKALKKFMDSLPLSAFLLLIFIWATSVFSGGLISGLISPNNWARISLITGSILLVGNIINMFMVPHPIWMNVVSVLMYLPLAYVGSKVVNRG